MAVISVNNFARLSLTYQTGVKEGGAPITKAATYSFVKPDSTADSVHVAAAAIAGLSTHPLVRIERLDKTELVQQ